MPPKSQPRHTLSYQLREIIDSRGLSAYAAAKLAEVDPGVVSRWMNGQRDIRMETADRLALALGLRIVETPGSRSMRSRPASPGRPPARPSRPAPPVSEDTTADPLKEPVEQSQGLPEAPGPEPSAEAIEPYAIPFPTVEAMSADNVAPPTEPPRRVQAEHVADAVEEWDHAAMAPTACTADRGDGRGE